MAKPWEVKKHPHYPGILVVEGPAMPISIITTASDIDIAGSLERIDQAHLIAAAPELLEALEALVLFSKPTKTNAVALNHAYQVIAKARGDQ